MSVLTLEQAEDLAARTLTAIDAVLREPQRDQHAFLNGHPVHNRAAADRERVASDLEDIEMLDAAYGSEQISQHYWHHLRESRLNSIKRTARLYGVAL